MITLTVALAVVIGIALGLMGGGGSTLMVPLLTFGAGLDARHAVDTALVVVSITCAVGAVAHALSGRVQWRAALVLGVTGMAGAYLGGRLATHLPSAVCMAAFAGSMVVSAIGLLHERKNDGARGEARFPGGKLALLGVVVGVVSGLTGAGGGFLLVAALTFIDGLAMPIAVGTSLVVIAMHGVAALAGRLSIDHVDWSLALLVSTAAVVGSLIAERIAPKVDPYVLRLGFGVLSVLMAAGVVARETGSGGYSTAAGLSLAVLGCGLLARCHRAVRRTSG